MKKIILVLMAGFLAFSTVACQKTAAEKLCKKQKKCAKDYCSELGFFKAACQAAADDAEEICLDKAQEDEEKKQKAIEKHSACQKCYDAQEEYSLCVLENSQCDVKTGDLQYDLTDPPCAGEAQKAAEACQGNDECL